MYPRDETLTAIVLGFKNEAMIADKVMPRTSALSSPKYRYMYYAPGQFAYVPDTTVGRRTHVNEVEFKGTEFHGETKEHALKHGFVPRDYDGVKNPDVLRASAASALVNLIDLDREIRVAKIVMDETNYGSNYATLSGSDLLIDPYSDPVKIIREVLNSMRIRANTLTMGQKEWDALASHPKILAAVTRASGMPGQIAAAGIASKEEVARLFSLKEIVVGESLVSSSYGENATFSPAWAGGIAFHYLDASAISGVGAGMNNGMTWGFTAHHDKFSNKYTADHEGTRGVEFVRVVDDCQEKVLSPDCGFLLKGVI